MEITFFIKPLLLDHIDFSDILSSGSEHEEREEGIMARPRKYGVTLTEEHTFLQSLLRKGAARARVVTRARLLLLAAEGRTNPFIAEVLQVSPATVTNICTRFVQGGLGGSPQCGPGDGRLALLYAESQREVSSSLSQDR